MMKQTRIARLDINLLVTTYCHIFRNRNRKSMTYINLFYFDCFQQKLSLFETKRAFLH